MGPGFKYHIVSISAIFFALTIGLVVGSVFVSPQFARSTNLAIVRLQETLNTDIEDKRREIAQYKECVSTISPIALKGKLSNATVAIIQTGDYPDDAAHAADAIALATPRSIVHIVMTAALDRSPEDVGTVLTNLHSANPQFPADRDSLMDALSTALDRGDPLAAPILPLLEHEGFLRLTPDDNYHSPVKIAVIVMGSRSTESVRAVRLDIPLIRALLKQGITVIACEGTSAAATDVPALSALKNQLSSVDNIDTEIGRSALILALSEPHGAFGVKAAAEHLMPSSNSP